MLDLVKSQRQAVENALKNANNPLWIDSATVKDNQSSYDRFLLALNKHKSQDQQELAQKLAEQLAHRADEQNHREVAENLKRQAGVDLQAFLGNSERVQERLQQLTTANVALIKSIPTQYLDKVELAVTQAIVKGDLSSELTKKIMEIGQSTESRAKLIARDQASKFNAALTQARHEDLGITHYRWSTSGDERVRESHIENDGKVFAYDDPPEEAGHPGHDINCFPGFSKLNGFPRINKLYRRWYSGKLSKIVLSNGVVLLATPNHPILTNSGIKAIQSIYVGDYVGCESDKTFNAIKLNGKSLIPTFEQVFSTLLSSGVAFDISPQERGKFHGDISNSEIDIVSINSLLVNVWNSSLLQKLSKLGFTQSDMAICHKLFSCDSSTIQFNLGSCFTDNFLMGRFDLICSLLISHFTPLELFCLGLGSDFYIIGEKITTDNIPRNIEMFSDHIFACSALVHSKDFIKWQRDRIMSGVSSASRHCYAESFESLANSFLVKADDFCNFGKAQSLSVEFFCVVESTVVDFSGHIYNLETVSGYYNTSSVFVSNCRCVAIPVLDKAEIERAEQEKQEENDIKPKSGKMDLEDLIDVSIGGGGNKLFSDIGTIHTDLVELAKKSIGLDISDWIHNVDESGIRHTFKQHGNEKTESKRGQRAVTKQDILLLPLIIKQFDSIEYSGLSDLGNETFLLKKEIGDEIYTVQEVRKKHKKLTMKTMWIRRKSKRNKKP